MRYFKPKKIPGSPTVGVAVASFLNEDARRHAALMCLAYSFLAQSYPRWQLRVVHDGPPSEPAAAVLEQLRKLDKRIRVDVTPERQKQFGHPHRQGAIERLIGEGCEWIGLTNDDNYYVPAYLEAMLGAALDKPPADMIYCDLVHSHKMWRPVATAPARGKLDLGAFLVRAALCRRIRFDNFGFAGDGDYIGRMARTAKVIRKLPGTLFVHN
jgi:hypothetical protein